MSGSFVVRRLLGNVAAGRPGWPEKVVGGGVGPGRWTLALVVLVVVVVIARSLLGPWPASTAPRDGELA
jgi:hypothetical protein